MPRPQVTHNSSCRSEATTHTSTLTASEAPVQRRTTATPTESCYVSVFLPKKQRNETHISHPLSGQAVC